MVVLVGNSSTGKTRACWEAVQPLAGEGWRLWHPFGPTRAEAALEDLERVRPRTVVWLNEAQHYLGDDQVGERIAAAVHSLLIHPQQTPVLILGTLWPEYARAYTALPRPGGPDSHSRVRELLAGRTLSVPDRFDAPALRAASALAKDGDRLLADTLTRAKTHGQVTQDLAGVPELLQRYEYGTPTARAVLEVAMDARRLGVGLHLPQAFLTDAAIDYLSDTDYDNLTDDWAEAAFAELAHLVHGKQAPLRRAAARPARRPPGTPPPTASPGSAAGPSLRLADYLEQHGRTARRHLCPPASFWHAASTRLTHPDDLYILAKAARVRHRLQSSHHLYYRAIDAGRTDILMVLARLRDSAGDREGAETLYRQAADAGHAAALTELAYLRREAGDREGAEVLAQQAADAGDPGALTVLAQLREEAGDLTGAEALTHQALKAGYTLALGSAVRLRKLMGDREGAEALAQQAADAGDPGALTVLARLREEEGDREGAEALAYQALATGHAGTMSTLARMRKGAGDREGAEALAQQAADAGHTGTLADLASRLWPYGLDPDGTPTSSWQ
ncbi:tetratricopeptide repeat protein [Streptomyces sp. NPDC056704]|uniref:tetratricopeptide repeat protein n=1 Tax=Streptomyces sp. NPDC056704 TaxID=3345917 RepID=UPI00368C76CB